MKNSRTSPGSSTSLRFSTRLIDTSWRGMKAAVLAPMSIMAPLGSMANTVPFTTSPGLKL
jgi:hypothetical protein